MIGRREVKSINIEYEDGEMVSYKNLGIFHRAGINYPGGAHPRPDASFISHEVHWTQPLEESNEANNA